MIYEQRRAAIAAAVAAARRSLMVPAEVKAGLAAALEELDELRGLSAGLLDELRAFRAEMAKLLQKGRDHA